MLSHTHPVTRVCTGTRSHVHPHAHTCVHTRVHTHVYAHTRKHTHVGTHVHTCRHTCAHTHLYTHMCAHTLACALTPQDTCAEDPAPAAPGRVPSLTPHPPHGQLRPGGSRTHVQSLQGSRRVHMGALGPGPSLGTRAGPCSHLPGPAGGQRSCPRSSPQSPAPAGARTERCLQHSSDCPCPRVKAGGGLSGPRPSL